MGTDTGNDLLILEMKRVFNAPREAVFNAWTDTEALTKWFAPGDDFKTTVHKLDVRVGGGYRFEILEPDGSRHIVVGEYVLIEKPEKLVLTWAWESKPPVIQMLVTIELFDQGENTELVLTHEQIPNQAMRDAHEEGWTGCLGRLDNLVST